MKATRNFICLLAIAAYMSSFAVSFAYAPSSKLLGTNLEGLADWTGANLFVDLMKKSRDWITQSTKAGDPWDTQLREFIPRDENGYALKVPFSVPGKPDQTLITVINSSGTQIPVGDYLFLYEGEGNFLFWPNNELKYTQIQPGKGYLTVSKPDQQIFLQIRSSKEGDHLRNMKLLVPGHHENYEQAIFFPKYLDLLKPFKVFRFMDLMNTNGSKIENWSERTLATSNTQTARNGLAVEYIIELSNRAAVDPWITIPHKADDNYVRELAKVYKAKLDKKRNLYLEYSNEIWNWQFEQTRYCDTKGKELGFDKLSGGAVNNFYSYRSVQIIKIFEEVFAEEKDRIIGVMAGQSVNPWHLERRLEYNWATRKPSSHAEMGIDCIAIAPYFHLPDPKTNLATYEFWSDTLNSGGLDKLFQEIRTGNSISVPSGKKPPLLSAYDDFTRNKIVADKHSLTLLAYEGGQHLVAGGGLENNQKLTNLFIAANRDPRMGEIYGEYFRKWFQAGGGIFANFSFISRPSKWGSWGILENQEQDLLTAFKYSALAKYANELNIIYDRDNDTEAPSPVTNLIATNITDNSLTLSWSQASDNLGVIKYAIYRDGIFLKELNELKFSDSALTAGASYTYSVVAFDLKGNQSTATNLLVTTEKDKSISISSCEALEDIGKNLKANYKLTADIDCSATNPNSVNNFNSRWGRKTGGFTPIGNYRDGFSGVFDGQGYSISNLYVSDKWGAGLFTKITAGTVKNLSLKNVIIDTNQYVAGFLAGVAVNSVIDNVQVQGDFIVDPLQPKGLYGGLVGNMKAENGQSLLLNSASKAFIQGKYVMSGGLVGIASGNNGVVQIKNSSFSGNIDAKDGNRVGAILGLTQGDTLTITIDGCSINGTMTISGGAYGPVLGQANQSSVLINNCHSHMKISATNTWGDHQLYGQDLRKTVKVTNSFIDKDCLINSKSRKLDGVTIVDPSTKGASF